MAYIDKYGVEFSDDRKVLIKCTNENIETYTIPDDVECISALSFFGCKQLSDIVIPPSVQMIKNGAFCGCHNLSTIHLPDSVEYIGRFAFASCRNLTNFTLLYVII